MANLHHETDAFELAASDLSFAASCPRCIWLKVRAGLPRPRGAFPKIFGAMDRQIKAFFQTKPTTEIAGELPPGRVCATEATVRSEPLEVPGHKRKVILHGRLDTALAFTDGTFGIIDYKTSKPAMALVPPYNRQLLAYAEAVEHPDKGRLSISPVSRLGLVCIEPTCVVEAENGIAFAVDTTWVEIERDPAPLYAFMSRLLDVLEQDQVPRGAPDCEYGRYIAEVPLVVITGWTS